MQAEINAWEALLVGALQGLLEWVPVSSSGQLALLLTSILGLTPGAAYGLSMATHLGTAISGAIVTRRKALDALRLGPWLRVALIPLLAGAPIALLISRTVTSLSADAFNLLIGLLLLATAALVLRSGRSAGRRTALDLSPWELALVGVAQGLAALPGLSRSATTIAALLLLGLTPTEAVRASILMGAAATGAMGAYEILQGAPATPQALAIALAAALAAGLLSAGAMLALARKYQRQIAAFTVIIAVLAIISALPAIAP